MASKDLNVGERLTLVLGYSTRLDKKMPLPVFKDICFLGSFESKIIFWHDHFRKSIWPGFGDYLDYSSKREMNEGVRNLYVDGIIDVEVKKDLYPIGLTEKGRQYFERLTGKADESLSANKRNLEYYFSSKYGCFKEDPKKFSDELFEKYNDYYNMTINGKLSDFNFITEIEEDMDITNANTSPEMKELMELFFPEADRPEYNAGLTIDENIKMFNDYLNKTSEERLREMRKDQE